MNTMIELVTELKKLPQSEKLDSIIKEAEEGAYHDYRSSHVCGKVYAVSRLRTVGLPETEALANAIIEGDYDEDYTEEDQRIVLAEMDNDPNQSQANKDFFRAAMGGTIISRDT
jgi:hypothetical protein